MGVNRSMARNIEPEIMRKLLRMLKLCSGCASVCVLFTLIYLGTGPVPVYKGTIYLCWISGQDKFNVCAKTLTTLLSTK